MRQCSPALPLRLIGTIALAALLGSLTHGVQATDGDLPGLRSTSTLPLAPACVGSYYTLDGDSWFGFSEGDTIPVGSYVLFEQSAAPGLRHQTRIDRASTVNDLGAERFYRTQWSPAEIPDTLGFHVGPFDYSMLFRSVDELDQPSESSTAVGFVAGFTPQITGLSPQEGEALVLRHFVFEEPWPENEISYTVNLDYLPPGIKRWWDGSKYVFASEKGGSQWFEVHGHIYRYRVRFEGEADPREPDNALRSWSYEIFGQYDPRNIIKEGAGPDVLGLYETPGSLNEWEMSEFDDGVEIFIPQLIWISPQLFQPGFPYYPLGELLARQLGEIQLRVQARTTGPSDEHAYCAAEVRESCGAAAATINTEQLGRRTGLATRHFTAMLGLDPANTGAITEYWPPPGYVVPVLVSGLRARQEDAVVRLEWEWGADVAGERCWLERVAPDGSVSRLALEASSIQAGPAHLEDRPGADRTGQVLRYRLMRDPGDGEQLLAETSLLFEISRSRELRLHANVPNPFNPRTTLSFDLPQAARVRLSIHDVQGRRVRELVGERLDAGRHERVWDGRSDEGDRVASGVYFARLDADGRVDSIRMLLVK